MLFVGKTVKFLSLHTLQEELKSAYFLFRLAIQIFPCQGVFYIAQTSRLLISSSIVVVTGGVTLCKSIGSSSSDFRMSDNAYSGSFGSSFLDLTSVITILLFKTSFACKNKSKRPNLISS